MRGKKTPLDQRANAVGIALVAGVAEASRQTGIPEGTIYPWLNKPEFVELQNRNKDDVTAEWFAGVQLAFRRTIELLEKSEDPVKTATAGAIMFDKMALSRGEATSRQENWVNDHADHESHAIAGLIKQELARRADEAIAELTSGDGVGGSGEDGSVPS